MVELRVKLPIVEANSVGAPVPNSNTAIMKNWNFYFYFYWTWKRKGLNFHFYSVVKDGFEGE